jgi:putative membrane protein
MPAILVPYVAFVTYLVVACLLLSISLLIYVKITPINEFELVKENNVGAGLSLSGAILGFCFPIISATYFTHSLLEMMKWAGISLVAQLLLVVILRNRYPEIEKGNVAMALVVASLSIALGLLNAVSISY